MISIVDPAVRTSSVTTSRATLPNIHPDGPIPTTHRIVVSISITIPQLQSTPPRLRNVPRRSSIDPPPEQIDSLHHLLMVQALVVLLRLNVPLILLAPFFLRDVAASFAVTGSFLRFFLFER